MDSPAISPSISFLDPTGACIDGPQEWSEALVEIHIDPAVWSSAQFTINNVKREISLRHLAGHVRVLANWPRANAGTYELQVRIRDNSAIRRVTIAPSKLSSGAFVELISDLESRLPAAIVIALQRSGGLAGLSILPPEETTIAQELARLRRAVRGSSSRPGLATVLHGLALDPHHILESEELWTPTHRARRAHPARLIQAVRSPANMVDEHYPARVIDTRVKPSTDVYENRLVRVFHDQVMVRLLRLERILSRLVSNTALVEELRSLRKELYNARREARFLDDVRVASHLPTRVTMVLLKRPAYRAAFEGYLELHRSIAARLDEPALDLPLENLPVLYRLWGTLIACSAVLDVAVERGYRLDFQRLVRRSHDGVFVRMVPAGNIALRLVHPGNGTAVTLTPEKSFTSTGLVRSVSFVQIPDIIIEIDRPEGMKEILLLDPKYKLDSDETSDPSTDGRPKKIDIDKMHAYRDAIRDVDGRHLVTDACTIYPGPTVHYTEGLTALSGVPGSDTLYKSVSHLVSTHLTSP